VGSCSVMLVCLIGFCYGGTATEEVDAYSCKYIALGMYSQECFSSTKVCRILYCVQDNYVRFEHYKAVLHQFLSSAKIVLLGL